jgi:hypothetical protein
MQRIYVKDLAVALSDYATVDEQATLYDAIQALQRKRDEVDPRRPKYRAVLVLDKKKRVVGKIGYIELLQALEPKYGELDFSEYAPFTPDFIRSQLEKYSLFQHPLDDLCRKAAKFHVRNFMHSPSETEFIDENDTLDAAVHQFITLRALSLLTRRGNTVVGILRLSDVVEKISEMIQACEM